MLLVRSRSNYRVQALPNIKADRSWNLSRIASVHISFSSSLHTLRYVLASSLSLTPLSIIALFFFSLSFPFLLIFLSPLVRNEMMADQRFTLKQELCRLVFLILKKLHCHRMEEISISEMNYYTLLRKRCCVVIR